MSNESYVLGYSDRELERLDLQGALYRDITGRALVAAGLDEGMAVLDIGCGSGDVSRLTGELVGPSGSVLGIDHDEGTVSAARARAERDGLTNITFEAREIGADIREAPYDALVGRFVLMHQPDPAKTLAASAGSIRRGGIVVLVESNMASLLDAVHSLPYSSLYDEIVRWKCGVVGAAGADLRSGLRLRRTFLDAGLPEPTTRFEAPVEGGPSSPIYAFMADTCRSLLPQAARHGIGGLDEEAVETLEERLRRDIVAGGGVVLGWPAVAAWCRK